MQRQLEQATISTANVATGGSAVFGTMAYLNENAAAIGAICAIISLVVAILFYLLNYRIRVRQAELDHEKVVKEVIGQIRSQVNNSDVDLALNNVKRDRRSIKK